MSSADAIESRFKSVFNEQPLLVRSPGRVNLLGEHTDYNLGYVLPAAINKSICFAISPRKDSLCKVVAADMNDEHDFTLDALHFSPKGWPNYLMGVVDQFMKAGCEIRGFNCVFGGDIPIGAGLSSSAALEAGLAFSLNTIFDLRLEDLTLVTLAQKAENEFVGVQCGIMDQYINIFGRRGNVARIDCRSLECAYYPFEYDTVSVVLFDTRVSHSLASTAYNQRRRECSEGVAVLKNCFQQVESLRDVSLPMLENCKPGMTPTVYKRCKYVVEENDRMLRGCRALLAKDLKSFGSLMYQTHEGLRYEYEVSCTELDHLVAMTLDNPHVYGARMMGGGFGGCTINLIENDGIQETHDAILKSYAQRFNTEPKMYVTSISPGTSVITADEVSPV